MFIYKTRFCGSNGVDLGMEGFVPKNHKKELTINNRKFVYAIHDRKMERESPFGRKPPNGCGNTRSNLLSRLRSALRLKAACYCFLI